MSVKKSQYMQRKVRLYKIKYTFKVTEPGTGRLGAPIKNSKVHILNQFLGFCFVSHHINGVFFVFPYMLCGIHYVTVSQFFN